MATRAFYLFRERRTSTCLYLHWDGYPEGAASYFHNFVNYEGPHSPNANAATRFILANPRMAEIVDSLDSVGGIEYQYILDTRDDGLFITAIHVSLDSSLNTTKRTIFDGSLADFIAQHDELIRAEEAEAA